MNIILKIIICIVLLFKSNLILAENFVDMIIIHKSERIMQLLKNGKVLKSYKIALGFDPIGHKQKMGDGKTPEGLYHIDKKLLNSDFHIALQVSYPNKWDKKRSLVNNIKPGGSIMIHGQSKNNEHKNTKDWTNGCIAVQNNQIEEINKLVKLKTPIYIKK